MLPIRARAELETILALNESGVLSSDDYSVYNGYDVKAQQKCLAHLRRHFKKPLSSRFEKSKNWEKFVKLIDEAFKNYSLFQQNQNISEFFAWAWKFKLKVKSSLINGWHWQGEKPVSFCALYEIKQINGGIF